MFFMRYLDLHADTLTEITAGGLRENDNDIDFKRIQTFCRQYVQVFAIWKDAAKVGNREKAFCALYSRAMELVAECEDVIMLCRSGSDLKTARRQGKMAAFLSIEDISLMGKYACRCKELGFSFAMLTWNYENEYACGAMADQKKGLTASGRELVRVLEREGVIVDVSHLSDQGIEELLAVSSAPIIASHSNVRSCKEHPRNLLDCHIREIIARGGIIGMNFYRPFVGDDKAGVRDWLRHIDRVLALGGEKTVALGGDFDGCGGEFIAGIRGVESVAWLWQKMRQAGFEEKLLQRIFFENGENFLLKHVKG